MNAKHSKTVYRAEGILQAVVVKLFLEQAGLSADLAPAGQNNYLDVQVPAAHAANARDLLNHKVRYGEILYPAASL